MSEYSSGIIVTHSLASVETLASHHQFVTPDHLFNGLAKLEDFQTSEMLAMSGLPAEKIPSCISEIEQLLGLFREFNCPVKQARRRMRVLIGDGNHAQGNENEHPHRSPESRAIFERADQIARENGAPVIAVQHLLAALLENPEGNIRHLLAEFQVDVDAMAEAARSMAVPVQKNSNSPLLDQYGVDLTEQAHMGNLPETIGRRDEMLQVIRVLGRDTKNNPVLIGEAGVGKTAIVEGLACRIASGNIHPDFQNKRIVQLNAADLVAGTKYRGEFEERVRGIIEEAGRGNDLILFIDELHLLVGAGSTGSGMDAANIFKPALARSKMKLIGATTEAEYHRYIAKDAALERRFQPIRVEEPNVTDTLKILNGLRARLEKHHSVLIQPDAIEAAVQLSVRYITDRRLPDKARDLLDDACARVHFGSQISHDPDAAIEGPSFFNLVSADIVQEVVAEKIGVPVGQLSADESKRVLKIAELLQSRVIGQNEAIDAVSTVIKRHYAGLNPTGRPIGVFLFVGPTGVGKTELAKAIANFLFGADDRMIRLDLSEYGEKHNVARLVGSPPGYVGYEEGGQLTGALRKTPYAVVLLDEVDKAHPDVLNIFLQAFGEGRLTDGQGRTIDASNVIFILTSNLGYELARDPRAELPAREAVEQAVHSHFRPEFLNRIDAMVHFQPLQPADMQDIVRIQIAHLEELLARRDVSLVIDDDAVCWLADRGYDRLMGARPLIRLINDELVNVIGGLLLSGVLKPTHVVHVTLVNDQLNIGWAGADTV